MSSRAERPRNHPAHVKSRTPNGFQLGIAQNEAHESRAGFSTVFRTIPVARDICRPPEPLVAPARVARDTRELFEWRQGNESQSRFACAPGSEGIRERQSSYFFFGLPSKDRTHTFAICSNAALISARFFALVLSITRKIPWGALYPSMYLRMLAKDGDA